MLNRIVIGLLLIILLIPELVLADTHTAADCEYATVSTAIIAASAGDTVTVPAGSCTWASALTITKGINLIGAGIGVTNITSSYTGSYLITYTPSAANIPYNYPFRISGFTFDFDTKCGGLYLHYSDSTLFVAQTNIRIDHNRFYRATTQAIVNSGMRGVVDNNTFDGTAYPNRAMTASSNKLWYDNWTFAYSDASQNMYFEDNIFNNVGAGGSGPITDCQEVNRYAYRYNTINIESDRYPLFDLHGNQSSTFYACFGGEVYGNQITGNYENRFVDQRAGRMTVFYNNFTSSSSVFHVQVREEYDDAISPTTNTQPQHVSDSYYWANYRTGGLFTVEEGGHVGDIPLENRDFWRDARIGGGSFDGTVGIGCGTVAQMNAITTCTEGVGFWATNQSCSNLSGLVGANPTTPISGTLYKCGASNNWVSYYTPLAYPHPLRGEESIPSSIQGLTIQGGTLK